MARSNRRTCRTAFKGHSSYIINNLNVVAILPYLVNILPWAANHITNNSTDTPGVQYGGTNKGKAFKLVYELMKTDSPSSLNIFLNALRQTDQDHIADMIEGENNP